MPRDHIPNAGIVFIEGPARVRATLESFRETYRLSLLGERWDGAARALGRELPAYSDRIITLPCPSLLAHASAFTK
jgi:hypothetical protein